MNEHPGEPRHVEIDRIVATSAPLPDRGAIACLPDLIAAAVADRLRGQRGGRTGSAIEAIADRVVSEMGATR